LGRIAHPFRRKLSSAVFEIGASGETSHPRCEVAACEAEKVGPISTLTLGLNRATGHDRIRCRLAVRRHPWADCMLANEAQTIRRIGVDIFKLSGRGGLAGVHAASSRISSLTWCFRTPDRSPKCTTQSRPQRRPGGRISEVSYPRTLPRSLCLSAWLLVKRTR
jgi:hypothetical protein